ncbi:MAG: hypothetical protein NZ898_02890 [Myxococcota bacterium]|nr:hypothetical protein [Myxococcota bacterium]MDW8361320.1 hypothetical protein [Myxococcales bacterium]
MTRWRTLAPVAPKCSSRARLLLAALGVASGLWGGGERSAQAQRPLQQVLDLNRQAMEDYTNLEIEAAQQKLLRALQIAERSGVTGAPLARTLVNLGVVAIGGLGDNAAGLQYFIRAIQADRNVQLDPLTSTPDIQTMFNLARQRAGTAGGGQGMGPGPGPGPGPSRGPEPGPEPPPAPRGPGTIPHVPIPEQLRQTAVPVFVEVPAEAPVGAMYLYYRSTGMREFRRVEMRRMRGGYGYEIPCSDVFEPSVAYYIVAFGRDGSPLGFAGTAEAPLEVPIVAERTHPPPALPGSAPPEPCGESECPPGMPGCRAGDGRSGGGAGLGDTCRRDSDCRAGLVCRDEFCVSAEDEEEEDGEAGDAPRFFVHLGGTIGAAYVGPGMPADGPPPEDATEEERIAYVPGGQDDCNLPEATTDPDGTIIEGDYCVRIETPGFTPTYALRAVVGYYFTERIAVGGGIRFQFSSGQGTMAGLQLQLRGQYLLTPPRAEGFSAALMLGTSYGQIQPQPPQADAPYVPFVRSGLNGVQAGAVLVHRVARNFGFHLTPEIHILFPTFLFDIDLSAGLEIAF